MPITIVRLESLLELMRQLETIGRRAGELRGEVEDDIAGFRRREARDDGRRGPGPKGTFKIGSRR